MKNTTLLIIGLAAIGVGYYLWKKKDEKKEYFVSSTKLGTLSKNGL
jgi:LPXTG-motif cell wall-anchored protein